MRWIPNRLRPRAVEWRSNPSQKPQGASRRRLCDLLNADSLDDLVRIACEEAGAACGVSRLLVVGWNLHQLGPWAVFPQTAEDRLLSSTLEQRLNQSRGHLPDDASEQALLDQARAMGFERMAVIPSRRHLLFQVYWSLDSESRQSADLHDEEFWSDLEVALCNFARLEQLRELSHIDTLTNIFNRRYFNHRLTEEVARAGRFTRPLALAICDLDRFKLLNDTHGHQAGDVVLRYMAQTLRRSIRTIDIVCRLGGDEFAVLMPDTGAEECASLAERLRQSVASGGFTLGGKDASAPSLELRLSIGGAVFPEHAERPERLLWCADMALLAAKRDGGNRFVLCDPSRIQRGAAL
jgi:diguanylate cyclase (GGDEF)-like protein